MYQINALNLRIFKYQKHMNMPAREEIRRTDISKLIANKRTEKTDFRKSKNKTFKETENCITEVIEKIRKQNINKLIKNRFFIKKAETVSKEKLIIFSENISSFFTFFFLKSRNSERMKKTAI